MILQINSSQKVNNAKFPSSPSLVDKSSSLSLKRSSPHGFKAQNLMFFTKGHTMHHRCYNSRWYTVKPVYNGHPSGPKQLGIILRWPDCSTVY